MTSLCLPWAWHSSAPACYLCFLKSVRISKAPNILNGCPKMPRLPLYNYHPDAANMFLISIVLRWTVDYSHIPLNGSFHSLSFEIVKLMMLVMVPNLKYIPQLILRSKKAIFLVGYISDLAPHVCTHAQDSILLLELIVGNDTATKTSSITK